MWEGTKAKFSSRGRTVSRPPARACWRRPCNAPPRCLGLGHFPQ